MHIHHWPKYATTEFNQLQTILSELLETYEKNTEPNAHWLTGRI